MRTNPTGAGGPAPRDQLSSGRGVVLTTAPAAWTKGRIAARDLSSAPTGSTRTRASEPRPETVSEERPASRSSSSSPATSRRQPGQRPHVGLVPRPHGGHDRLQLGPRGQQLVRQPGPPCAGPDECLGERHQGRVVGLRRRRPGGDGDAVGRPLGAPPDDVQQLGSAAAADASSEAPDPPQRLLARRGCGGPARPAWRRSARPGRAGSGARPRTPASPPARVRRPWRGR